MLKNTIQGILILIGILLSFHIEESRIEQKNFEIKNELLSDLNRAISDDLEQIKNLKEILNSSLDSISELQDDMNKNHQLLSDEEVIKKLIDLNVSISFFPQDGIFTELISSGSFELIKSKELKSKLLEIYNHQKERNLSISDDIDVVMKDYELEIMTNFRIAIDYTSSDGEFYGKPILSDYEFNRDYYLSNKLYGLMSLNYLFGVMYSRLLDDFEKSHEATLALSMLEIDKS
ncbi:uncharacterized protein METZ01_LOCUS170449 [marine metagenome]|uniref:Uncharacterized protein n=1 Tax=marine metagenome TaxID=408172 RepID=A0A382BUW1_9ZZZZ